MSRFGDELARRGGHPADRHGSVVVGRSEWSAAVDTAEALSLTIIGFDGFAREGDRLVAMLDYVADFSDFAGGDGSASRAAARRVLDAWASARGGPEAVEFAFAEE